MTELTCVAASKTQFLPFKEHFVVNLGRSVNAFMYAHRRRYARKALQNVHIERCYDAIQFVDE